MRQARSRAWTSVMGFQSGSKSTTLSAPTMFKPTPPMRVVRTIAKKLASALNSSIFRTRLFTGVLLSILRCLYPCSSIHRSMTSSIFIVCTKTNTRWPSSFHRPIASAKTFILPDLSQLHMSGGFGVVSESPRSKSGWLHNLLHKLIAPMICPISREPPLTSFAWCDCKKPRYAAYCSTVRWQRSTCSSFFGSWIASITSGFVRLKMAGLVSSRSAEAVW
mmetsp:Transcript_97079/g.290014  ORF Transcript_97079/g.290014 Transcript_97079/m.290014 type:complete len:220 (+) Transcript_97079:1037-1696(+)